MWADSSVADSVTAQICIQLPLPFLVYFSISHPNAGYIKDPFFFSFFFFWGVRPPLNPPLFEVLFRRDTCILLFPFKPKTLPFEDETKMPLFSLQGYLKTLKCFDTYSCGNLTLVEYHWKRFSVLMDSVLFPDEVLCATLRVFNMALLWRYQHLSFILKQECLGLFSLYLFVQFQPLFW